MSSEQATAAQPSNLVRSFTPFIVDELAVLERFVEQCDRMRDSRLMSVSQPQVTVQGRPTMATELRSRLPELAQAEEIIHAHPTMATQLNVSEEDIGAFLMPFRQLYQQSDDTEVGKVRKLLSKHAHAKCTPEGTQTVDELKTWKADYQDALRESPMGTMFELEPGATESVEYTPKDIIENWLNGVFFHWKREAAGKVEGPDRAMHAFFLIAGVQHVARYMLELGELARAIVSEPALHAS